MKVSLFIPTLEGGGAERVILNLAKGFSDKGYDVDIVLVTSRGKYLNQVPSNVRVVDLKTARVIRSLFKLVKYLKDERPEVMISALSHTNIIAICAMRFANVKTKLIITEHTTVSLTKNTLFGKVMMLLRGFLYPKADKIVAVSNGVAEDLIQCTRISPTLVDVIYNPVIDENLLVKSTEVNNDDWINSAQQPVILSVGRLTEAKSYDILIKSFALARKSVDARLIILGDGELRRELEDLIKNLDMEEKVRMPGFVDNPFSYMANANLFVMSSTREGLSNVLIEALACGARVLSTDCPSGPREILDSGKYGTLIEVGNEEEMAKAIVELLSSDIPTVNKVDLESHLKQFNITSVVNKYLTVISKDLSSEISKV